ncbi:MAG: hypothetical protein GX087_01105 [Desulfobulbaceae bacterium]|nr:hypothetical protein [Desulfobulbaceae bacterium]
MSKKLLYVLLFASFVFQVSCEPVYYHGPVSDHFDGQRFFNPGQKSSKTFKDSLLWMILRDRPKWPKYQELPVTDQPPARVKGGDVRLSYVGHVSMLLQTRGMNILLDPVWSDRASPLSWAGPKRAHPPGIRFEDLPTIDVVLITHNHYDHLDLSFLQQLWQRDKPRIIAPLGNDTVINRKIPQLQIETYDWAEQVGIGADLVVHLVPALHWSARSIYDRGRALWASFVLETPDGNLYLVGDTAFGDGDIFRQAAEKYGPFRLALLPIGAYLPRWFMSEHHMDPQEAVQAHKLLGAQFSVPVHYGVFPLADDPYDGPLKALRIALEEQQTPPGQFHIMQPGTYWLVP